jgi:hypothetical protein
MNEKIQKFILLAIGVLAMSLAIGYLVFAWVEPTAPPPGGNVPAPINVGTTTQTKLGGFTIDTTSIGLDEPFLVRKNNYYFFVGVNRGGGDYVDIGAYREGVGWKNLILNRDGGNVGIGTTSPGYKLDVKGDINYSGGLYKNGIRGIPSEDMRPSWYEDIFPAFTWATTNWTNIKTQNISVNTNSILKIDVTGTAVRSAISPCPASYYEYRLSIDGNVISPEYALGTPFPPTGAPMTWEYHTFALTEIQSVSAGSHTIAIQHHASDNNCWYVDTGKLVTLVFGQ